jgi:hypothetical protein
VRDEENFAIARFSEKKKEEKRDEISTILETALNKGLLQENHETDGERERKSEWENKKESASERERETRAKKIQQKWKWGKKCEKFKGKKCKQFKSFFSSHSSALFKDTNKAIVCKLIMMFEESFWRIIFASKVANFSR